MARWKVVFVPALRFMLVLVVFMILHRYQEVEFLVPLGRGLFLAPPRSLEGRQTCLETGVGYFCKGSYEKVNHIDLFKVGKQTCVKIGVGVFLQRLIREHQYYKFKSDRRKS